MIRRRAIGSSLVLLAIAALLVGALIWLGYFDRDPVKLLPTGTQGARSQPVAVLYLSSDLGLRIGMGPKITTALVRWGIPVVAVSSPAYFRHERSAAEVTGMIAQGIDRARNLGRTNSVILIGQSFGADMLHVGLAGLKPEQRKYIHMVILVVPTMPIYRQITLGEFSGLTAAPANAAKTASQLRWTPVLCIYGAEEDDSLCPRLMMPNVQRIALPGGHRLGYDSSRLINVLRWAIGRYVK